MKRVYDVAALNAPIDEELLDSAVARISGVNPGDSRLEAVRKAVDQMEGLFGKDNPKCRQARRMYEEALKQAAN